jgi:uncharacterized protein (TIGR03437 family)
LRKLKSIYFASAFLAAVVSLQAQVTVDKTSVTLSGQVGGPAVQQTINVSSSSSSAIFYLATISESTASGVQWLRFGGTCNAGITGTNGTTPASFTITADPSCVGAGTYNGSITISPQTAGSVNVVIPVTFTVSSVGVSPSSLTFAYQTGGTIPSAQSLTVTGPNSAFTAAASTSNGGTWLQVAPTSGAITGGSATISAILDPNITPTLAAGTYNGAITITPSGSSSNTPVSVPVTLTVTVPPPVTISSNSLQINYQIGGSNNSPQQVLTISTTSTQALSFGLSATVNNNPSGRSWIILNPSSGTVPAIGSTQVTVSYDTTANLPAGTWAGQIMLFTPGATPAQQTINVSLLVSTQPLISVPNAGLNFAYELNSGATPPAQSIVVTSTNAAPGAATGQIPVTASATTTNGGSGWLTVTPSLGTTGTASPFSIAVNPTGLVPGKYQGTVTFTGAGAGNGPQSVPVTLTVGNDPSLIVNQSSLTFENQIGQAPVATPQTSQVITVGSSTGATLNYTATAATNPAGGSWLVLSGNTTGSTNNVFTVTVLPSGLAAGTYTGTVTITATNPTTGNGAVNSPVIIPVTFYVSASPLLVVTLPGIPPSQPVLTAQINGAPTATQAITLNSTNPAVTLNYSAAFSPNQGGNWLLFNANGTTAPGSNVINISANPGLLSAGTYTGTLTITATGSSAVANSPYNIPITFQVTSGTIQLSQTSLQFSQLAGGTPPVPQTVTVSSNGQPLNFQTAAAVSTSVPWLSATPATGNTSSSGVVTVSVDGSKLSPGTYTATVTITSPGATNSPATITVTLTVQSGTITASQVALTFQQVANSTVSPSAQTVNVTSSPTGLPFTVSATAANGGTWLSAAVVSGGSTSSSGTAPASVQVTVSGANSFATGTYTGTVTITSPGAAGSPITIPVTLNVVPPQNFTVTPGGPLAFNFIIGGTAPAAQQVQISSSGTTTFTATPKTTDGANWLAVTPSSGNVGTAPVNLSVQVTPTGLAVGNYTGTITISSPNLINPVVVNVTLGVSNIPTPVILGIRNAGSGFLGALAPGEIVAVYGTGIGPTPPVGTQLTSTGSVSTNIGNTQVFFDGVPAPIIFASASQTNVVVPYEVAGRPTATVTVVYSNVSSAPLTYNVQPTVPGVYTQNLTGTGPGAILNQDFSVNGPNKPAAANSVVAVYLTGDGVLSPPAPTGGVAPIGVLYQTVASVTATVGGQPAKVFYSGSSAGLVFGATQVNVQIPTGLTTGPQQIIITIGGVASQTGVTVQVQ